jgi:hypothetical protein
MRGEVEQDVKKEAMWPDDRTRTSLMDIVHPQLQLESSHRQTGQHQQEGMIYIAAHSVAGDTLGSTVKRFGLSCLLFI